MIILSGAERGEAWEAQDQGYLAWTMDPTDASTTSLNATAGVLYLARIRVPRAASVSTMTVHVATTGAGLTAGQNFANLYTLNGSLIAVTADQSASWNSTGIKSMTLLGGPHALAAGDYYAGFWFNGTTGPAFARRAIVAAAFTNVGMFSPLRAASADTGLTTTSPATFGAQTVSGLYWWVALS